MEDNQTQSKNGDQTSLDPNDQQSNLPKSWPGAFKIYKYSKEAIKFNLSTFLGILILSLAVSGFSSYFSNALDSQTTARLTIGSIVTMILSLILSVATTCVVIACVKRQKISIGESLNKAFSYVIKYLLMSVLSGLILLGSLLLLVVPFFFVLPRLLLAEYYLIDKNLGPIEAIKASWHGTKGHSDKVWGVIGASLAMGLLMFTIIGIPFSIYFLIMYSAASGVLYFFIKNQAAPADPPYPEIKDNQNQVA